MSPAPGGRPRRAALAGVLLTLVLVLALALRLKGIAYGLPFSFVNADESTVVPMAVDAATGQIQRSVLSRRIKSQTNPATGRPASSVNPNRRHAPGVAAART